MSSNPSFSVYVNAEFHHIRKIKVTSEIRPGELFRVTLTSPAGPVTYTLFRLLGAAHSAPNRVLLKPVPRPSLIRCAHTSGTGKKRETRDVSCALLLEVARTTDRLEFCDLQGNTLLTLRITEAKPRRSVTFNVAAADEIPVSLAAPRSRRVRVDVTFAAVEMGHNTQPFLLCFDGVSDGWVFQRSLLGGHIPLGLAGRISRSMFRVNEVAEDRTTKLVLLTDNFQGRIYCKDGSEKPIEGEFELGPGDSAEIVGKRKVYGPDGRVTGAEFPPISRGQFLSLSVNEILCNDPAAGGIAPQEGDLDSMITCDVLQDDKGDGDGYETQPEDDDDRRFIDDGIGARYTATHRVSKADAILFGALITDACRIHRAHTAKPRSLEVVAGDLLPMDIDLSMEEIRTIKGCVNRKPKKEARRISSVIRKLGDSAFRGIALENQALDENKAEWKRLRRIVKVEEKTRKCARLSMPYSSPSETDTGGHSSDAGSDDSAN